MAVSAILTLMTGKKREEELEWVSCIWYPTTFKNQTEDLLHLGSEVNAISSVFAFQLGLKNQKINVRAQKIDGTTLKTYGIVVSTFSLTDNNSRKRFFEENFLLIDVKPEIVLGMLFLTMSNADVYF